jgi:hypothetical protein
VLPFAIRNMTESTARGDRARRRRLGNWFGITPAPRSRAHRRAEPMTRKAVEVFKLATPGEQALFAELLLRKVQRKMKEAQ